MYDHPPGRNFRKDYELLEFAARLPAKPVTFTGQSASFQGFKGPCLLKGINLNNSNAGGQTLILWDGEDAKGTWVHQTFVGNGQNQVQPFHDSGILISTGLFVQLFGGPWIVSLYVVPLWGYVHQAPGE